MNYNLCDTIYARAQLALEEGKVFLWVGANTMVEYSIEEAEEMLSQRITGTETKLEELNEDLFALRGNCITVEVNIARIVNFGVKQKKLAALKAGNAAVAPEAITA